MVTLLEYKLNSLPEPVTSKYPALVHLSLTDINPEIVPIIYNNSNVNASNINNPTQNQTNTINNPNPVPEENVVNKEQANSQIEENKEAVVEPVAESVELTAEQKLNAFLEENKSQNLDRLFKMVKVGIPEAGVLQKAQIMGFDINLTNVLIFIFNFLANDSIIQRS